MRFLIVEDEKHLNDLLHDYIIDTYKEAIIDQVYDGQDAISQFQKATYDLVLLDVMLPHVNGFEIGQVIRKTSKVPIIFLSALSDEESQLKGYQIGIDDYVSKPYSPKIVIKKIEAVLARIQKETIEGYMSYGIIEYQLDTFKIKVDHEPVTLNKKEWELFTLFIHNIGRVFTREDLLNLVWGYDYFGYDRTVDTHIKRLRQKLGQAAEYIHTVYKSGYKFEK
ncbi:response regulator transcription factor [Acholeplasma vituli]|uniref:Response regulator transcription factor n=1 Tax=Paracholeplasma vituli TaxID=69473 RepID=A0ABT2PYW8_9MOLU|nr:response regulator transcription factor [Paracholeplasma vituli]MCU0104942.1 response regulator transcription factor [Paracholeplasma vituli]